MKIILPWDCLVGDNAKYGKGLYLTKEYRAGKEAAHTHVLSKVKRSQRLTGRVRMECLFYEPNRSRTRDILNYSKMLCDALNEAAFDDDGQIDDARFMRGPIDATNPRVEISLYSIGAAP